MRLNAEPLPLHLTTPFRIAYGSSSVRTNVLVRIGEGLGEGALPPYYGYKLEDVLLYLRSIDVKVLLDEDPFALEEALNRIPPGPAPARAALDIALHDVWGKHLGHPLYRLFGASPASTPPSSLTLSIPESDEALRKAVEDASGFPILKLKLGSGSISSDLHLVRTVRELTGARLCVDANGAWSLDEAVSIIPQLAELDLEFIEQPLAASEREAWHQLRKQLPSTTPLLIADESIQQPGDVLLLAGAVDGINIKLAKTGGIRGARRMIALARSLDLRVMLGCMIESSVAITAAGHLAALADYADLDGNVTVANDPFIGMRLDNGRIILPDKPGLGVSASNMS